MARKTFTREQIIGMLREAEVRLSQGQTIGVICKGFGISEQSYYRRRRDYGGPNIDQAKRLKDLERENERLRKAVFERKRCSDRTFHFVGEAARVMARLRSSWSYSWSYAYEQAATRTHR
jgi:hypothetical protein